jgi:hypothetical protein
MTGHRRGGGPTGTGAGAGPARGGRRLRHLGSWGGVLALALGTPAIAAAGSALSGAGVPAPAAADLFLLAAGLVGLAAFPRPLAPRARRGGPAALR